MEVLSAVHATAGFYNMNPLSTLQEHKFQCQIRSTIFKPLMKTNNIKNFKKHHITFGQI